MIFDYHSSPSAHTLFSTRRKRSAKPPEPRGSGGVTLLVLLQLAEVVIGFDGFRREGIILPPADKGGCHGQAGGDQLLQLGRLDGQHRVAGGAEDLIGQRQRVFERAVESATPDTAVRITVETGDSARRVMERLREAGLQVKDFDMRLAARLVKDHKLSSIHTGTYEFKPDLTPAGILETLARGPIVDQSLRIPDGAPVWEVLAIFRNATALKQTAASMPEAELRRALGIDAGSLEGWFAPDTYHYTSGSADLAVMKQAVAKQKALLAKAWESRSEAARVKTPYEALTLASIIEKETGLATDRHLVSSVFNNRLSIGMPLQTDPTVIYGLGEKFSGNITRKDLQTPTPYNTYVIPALPPTPIAAPTWASIEAAVNPADTRFLYFVSKGDGSSHFSQSLAEHNRAVRQFILNRPKTQKKAKPKEPQPTKETARSITPV